jgi:hypothetical protein
MLSVVSKPFMLSVIMLNVIMLSVVMLNVVVPKITRKKVKWLFLLSPPSYKCFIDFKVLQ